MSRYKSMFLSKFNPCPGNVELIDKSIFGELDEKAERVLMDHMESCPKCRKYQSYIESVEKGFSEFDRGIVSIVPLDRSEIPDKLQVEMAEAMKRNLSKWIFELCRGLMVRDGIVSTSEIFMPSELLSLKEAFESSVKILNSVKRMKVLSVQDHCLFSEVDLLVSGGDFGEEVFSVKTCRELLSVSRSLDDNFLYPLLYLDKTYSYVGEIKSATEIINDGIRRSVDKYWLGTFYVNQARNYYLMKDVDEGLVYYLKALDAFEDPVHHLGAGLVYLNKGDLNSAYNHYNRARNLSNQLNLIKRRSALSFCALHFKNHYNQYRSDIPSHDLLNKLFINHVNGGRKSHD